MGGREKSSGSHEEGNNGRKDSSARLEKMGRMKASRKSKKRMAAVRDGSK